MYQNNYYTIVKQITLEIFQIRKDRFLKSAPSKEIENVQKQKLFDKVEINLKDLWKKRNKKEQEICYDFFIQCSRTWEGFCLQEDQETPRFTFQIERYVDPINQIIVQTELWLSTLKDKWRIIEIDGFHKINRIKQQMIKNASIISDIIKQKVDQREINQFFNESQFILFKNDSLVGLWGFKSLTSNKIYLNDRLGFLFSEDIEIEALLVDSFAFWVIENKTPLAIISEQYQTKLKNGYLSELADVYLQTVYGRKIDHANPFGMCQRSIYGLRM